ncbi:MAG: hypothetical protein QGG36_21510 [Pirellulaceae bacterium]|jgi:hypothetical protein|nr:hypothetical protein [Pirellulaceae bacterium]
MNDQPGLSFFLQSILFQAPYILICLVGILASLLFMRRCTSASILCAIGLLVLATTVVGSTAIRSVIVESLASGGRSPGAGNPMLFIYIVASVFRAIGMIMIIAAVFVGRRPDT